MHNAKIPQENTATVSSCEISFKLYLLIFCYLFLWIISDRSMLKKVFSIPMYVCTGGGISSSQATPRFHAFIQIIILWSIFTNLRYCLERLLIHEDIFQPVTMKQ